jgi:hypothetical protein
MSYKGHDFAQLLEAFGLLDYTDGADMHAQEDAAIEALRVKLQEHWVAGGYDEEAKRMILEMRDFLTRLVEDDGTDLTPLWKGLLALDHDWTFVEYFLRLIRDMWS